MLTIYLNPETALILSLTETFWFGVHFVNGVVYYDDKLCKYFYVTRQTQEDDTWITFLEAQYQIENRIFKCNLQNKLHPCCKSTLENTNLKSIGDLTTSKSSSDCDSATTEVLKNVGWLEYK